MQYFNQKILAFLVIVWYNIDSEDSLANCACLEVHIEEGYDPFIMWRLSIVDSEKPQKWHKAKIYDTAKGRQYFKYGKIRIYLDEVMRV